LDSIGLNTTASGNRSFASGELTSAEGQSSTAMGGFTSATGARSFASGSQSVATQFAATAMGNQTTASGNSSTALGFNTVASGDYSTATGYYTVASGDYSFATGNRAEANGGSSFATGQFTKANGALASSFGNNTEANQYASFAAGSNTKAIGVYSTSFGSFTIAENPSQFSIGAYNTITGGSNSGTTTESLLFVIGNGTSENNRNDAFIVRRDGNAILAGALTQNSDRRLKTNIIPLTNTLDKIEQIQGVNYNWKNTETRGTDLQLGVIAQEVKSQYPELVKEDSNGILSVNYSGLVPVLLESIKELNEKLNLAEKDNATLKAEMNTLTSKVNRILSELSIDPQEHEVENTAEKE